MLSMSYGLWKPRIPVNITENCVSLAYDFALIINSSMGSTWTAGMTPPVAGGIDLGSGALYAVVIPSDVVVIRYNYGSVLYSIANDNAII